jgi:hypothetical protein
VGASRDDEYFKVAHTARADVGDHPEVQKLTPKVVGSLGRSEARGFLESLYSSLIRIDVFSQGGIFLGAAPGFNVNLGRLGQVAARIDKGLFFREFGRCLPDSHGAMAWVEDGLKNVDAAAQDKLRGMCAAVQSRPENVLGEGVLRYWFQPVGQEDPDLTFWVLIFYGRVGFIGVTAPKDKLPLGAPKTK